MPVSDKMPRAPHVPRVPRVPHSHHAALRERVAAFVRRPAFVTALAFAATLAFLLIVRRWADPVLLVCVAAAMLIATSAVVLARARHAGLSGANTACARQRSGVDDARMMAIVRSSMEAIITVDDRQRIVVFNPMAERIFGCPSMDAIGTPLCRFIPARFHTEHAKHVGQFGETRVSDRPMGRQRVLSGLRANGEEFPLEASISQIRDGNARFYTVILRDITERVAGERAQQQARDELRELSANLQTVREEEKARIARELHDDLGQQLTALKMDLSSLEQKLDASPGAPVSEQLKGMRRLIDTTVASVRRIAADLRPVMLDDLGLIPAIEWLLNDFTNRYDIEVERHIETRGTQFNPAATTALFRIVQEALTNVARHADATRVTFDLRAERDTVVLRIADNGQGARRASDPAGKSFGLLGIRERARMLGGKVDVQTARCKGFSLTVTVPVQTAQLQETQT